jgi:tetratricopeptide (TPR) repeat protein
MKKKQIIVIAAVVGVTVYLLFQPVKPLALAKPNDRGTGTVAQARQAQTKQTVNISVEMVSATAKSIIAQDAAANISALENKLKTATDENDQLALQKQLASAWDAANQPAPAAFYYQDIAGKENTAAAWVAAGSHFNDAYKLTEDTTAQPFFDAKAVEDFQAAMKLAPDNLDAKTGLGIAYVNGGGTPMQGIALLLDVVSKDPKNWNANFNLGLFSMKSGQFEKAVDRFKTASAAKPNDVEPVFYLAESYKQLGMKKEAIDAYKKCKQLMPDPTFDQKIDGYIKELSN